MNSQAIVFYHRGERVEVDGVATTRSVLDWLREDRHCTGTKEGCNEGDCGACTVIVGELADDGEPGVVGGLKLSTVNACIQFLPTLHGKALFTVEDLKTGGTLHPAQQAMRECHGSQCGFCTPGFVMSLWSLCERHHASGTRANRQQLADELSGNLCRCTGYRPILDAGERMFELPAAPLDTTPVVTALRGIDRDADFSYVADGRRFDAPASLDSLAALREASPDALLLAGSTDIGLWVNKLFKPVGDLIYLGRIDALRHIETRDDGLWIGAGASLEAAWDALAQRHASLTEMWLRFASPPIRNAGTMGGNVANGSPIGDSAPVLMALDAQLELRRGERLRRVPLDDFYTGYMKNRLEAGEFVQAIVVPDSTRHVRAYKISKRFDSDISAVCAGLSITLDGDTVRAVRLAFGGMAATVRRARQAEAALAGQPWTEASIAAAQLALAQDFQPLSDLRAGAAYRMQVAQNLLQRFWLETRSSQPLPPAAASVWQPMRDAAATP